MELQSDNDINTEKPSEVINDDLNISRSPVTTPTSPANSTNKPGGDMSDSNQSEVIQDNQEIQHLGAASIPANRLVSSADEADSSFDDLSEGSVPEFRGPGGVPGGRRGGFRSRGGLDCTQRISATPAPERPDKKRKIADRSPTSPTETLTRGKAIDIISGTGTVEQNDVQGQLANMMLFLSAKIENSQAEIQSQIGSHTTRLASLESKVSTVQSEVTDNTSHISQLDSRQVEMEDRLSKLELYSRHGNLLVSGVSEEVTDLHKWFYETLLKELGLKDPNNPTPSTIKIDKIHRIPGYLKQPQNNPSTPTRPNSRPRKVLIKFMSHSDREEIFKLKSNLRNTGLFLEEHLPDSYEKKRKPLYNIAKIARSKGRLTGKMIKATVKEDYLLLDGKKYTADNLDSLPPQFEDAKNHCLITPQQVSFLGFRCPLSNFYPCQFRYNEENFTSSEQFIQLTKAKRFPGNEYLQNQIKSTHDPNKIKNLGQRVRNFSEQVWRTEAVKLLYPGLEAKFRTCEAARKFLLNTGDRLIVEASQSDTLFGVGQAVTSASILNPDTFVGKNIQGSMLMTIRDSIHEHE